MRRGFMWGKDRRSREEKNAAARENRAAKKAEAARIADLEARIAATRWRLDDQGTEHAGPEFEWNDVQMAAMLEVRIGESTEFWCAGATITRLPNVET